MHTGSTIKFSNGWDQIFANAKGKKTRDDSGAISKKKGDKKPATLKKRGKRGG